MREQIIAQMFNQSKQRRFYDGAIDPFPVPGDGPGCAFFMDSAATSTSDLDCAGQPKFRNHHVWEFKMQPLWLPDGFTGEWSTALQAATDIARLRRKPTSPTLNDCSGRYVSGGAICYGNN